MDPDVWGPPLWDLLFTVAFQSRDRARVVTLFGLLEKVIPCRACRRSYAQCLQCHAMSHIREGRPDSAAIWLWTIHDMVNQKLGKTAISFEKVKKRHMAFSRLTHDLLVVDLLTAMTLVGTESCVQEFATTLCEILRHVDGFRVAEVLNTSSSPFIDCLYRAHVNVSEGVGPTDSTLEAFCKRVQTGQA